MSEVQDLICRVRGEYTTLAGFDRPYLACRVPVISGTGHTAGENNDFSGAGGCFLAANPKICIRDVRFIFTELCH